MLIDFHQMPDNARLWIYPANRKFTPEEVFFIRKQIEQFLNQWQAHGQDLEAAYSLEYNQFLIITVDESFSRISGCSIDASVHLINVLENELGVSFITTDQVAFMTDDGEISLFPFNQLKSLVQEKVIKPDTKLFDNTVKNLAEFKQKWLAASSQTWVNRYFQ